MPKSNIITLPAPGELAILCEDSLTKLPTDAVHNHLHQVAEQTRAARVKLENVELASILLCAVELDYQKGEPLRQSGSPWKTWVSENCDFSHKTATKYARVLKCAREGLIKGLSADLIPEKAPSLMSKSELQDYCTMIANALQELGGIRQLYLQLEIIKVPTKTIETNRNTEGGPSKDQPEEPSLPDPNLERDDARAALNEGFEKIESVFKQGRHQILGKADLQSLDSHLQSLRDEIKPLLQNTKEDADD